MKLRNCENIKILRNVDNPVMFLGFPLKLAYMYIGSIMLGFMSALSLSTMGVHLIYNILIPIIIGSVGVTGVTIFYKKYGINGYFLKQEDKFQSDFISGDVSFQQYFKNKKTKKIKL